jgi:hypothetical protein
VIENVECLFLSLQRSKHTEIENEKKQHPGHPFGFGIGIFLQHCKNLPYLRQSAKTEH